MPWLLLLLGADCTFILLLWLADIKALQALAAFLVLGTLLLFLQRYASGITGGRRRFWLF